MQADHINAAISIVQVESFNQILQFLLKGCVEFNMILVFLVS
jgi:hypothetical protein